MMLKRWRWFNFKRIATSKCANYKRIAASKPNVLFCYVTSVKFRQLILWRWMRANFKMIATSKQGDNSNIFSQWMCGLSATSLRFLFCLQLVLWRCKCANFLRIATSKQRSNSKVFSQWICGCTSHVEYSFYPVLRRAAAIFAMQCSLKIGSISHLKKLIYPVLWR